MSEQGEDDESVSSSSTATGGRRLLRRGSLICSSGKDQHWYDCEQGSQAVEKARNVMAVSADQESVCGTRVQRNMLIGDKEDHAHKAQFINGRYNNPWDTWKAPTITNVFKFGLSRDNTNVPSKSELDMVLPILTPNFSEPIRDAVSVTWLGHSTLVVNIDGVTLLTDPMLSERASPSQMFGPKRFRSAACSVADLPRIDAVVISHNHYDHLDLNTVSQLNDRFGSSLRWFVPMGLATWMQNAGCENIVQLEWWEENCVPEHSDVSFVFTPAQHWSKRTITDDNKSLWGSWSIIGPKNRFFFAGDTGYCSVFKRIGHLYGPFDVAAIPIGAYEPRWFMKYQHINPEEAVQIHQDIKSRKSVAIHWGTFALANEYYLDPPIKLRSALELQDVPLNDFVTLKHGETKIYRNTTV